LPVVFDFDNTLVCGDIGEAALAVLARSSVLIPSRINPALCPPLKTPGGNRVTLESCREVTEYYEAFLAPTIHGRRDPAPLASGYVWATQALEGLTVAEVMQATQEAFALSRPGQVRPITVPPGARSYPAPFFYPEMVELIAQLLEHQFEVRIVSASNVWSVRWMVLHGLNPALRQQGSSLGLRPEHVIGISTLLSDPAGRLYKDSVLVREDSPYARMAAKRMGDLRLTSHLQFPVPVYSGKVGCIFDAIGREPYLCVGDSPADHPMLAFSQNRLWIARVEKPESLKATQALMKRTTPKAWLVQTVRTERNPGFIK